MEQREDTKTVVRRARRAAKTAPGISPADAVENRPEAIQELAFIADKLIDGITDHAEGHASVVIRILAEKNKSPRGLGTAAAQKKTASWEVTTEKIKSYVIFLKSSRRDRKWSRFFLPKSATILDLELVERRGARFNEFCLGNG